MRKTILFIALCMTLIFSAQAKNNSGEKVPMVFYGVDFSLVQTIGSKENETFDRYRNAFTGINSLFISEPKKYNLEKCFGTVMVNEASVGIKLAENLQERDLSQPTLVDSRTISDLVKGLDLPETDCTEGVIIVANLLDKASKKGTFTYVVFNIKTRDIEKELTVKGSPYGFGIRNYWASAILDSMGKAKKYLKEIK